MCEENITWLWRSRPDTSWNCTAQSRAGDKALALWSPAWPLERQTFAPNSPKLTLQNSNRNRTYAAFNMYICLCREIWFILIWILFKPIYVTYSLVVNIIKLCEFILDFYQWVDCEHNENKILIFFKLKNEITIFWVEICLINGKIIKKKLNVLNFKSNFSIFFKF